MRTSTSKGNGGWRSLLVDEREQVLRRLGAGGLGEGTLPIGVAEEDVATLLHEQFISEQAAQRDIERLRDVVDALARLQHGEYGRCLECQESIPAKRLKALPWARYCVACQEELSRPPTL